MESPDLNEATRNAPDPGLLSQTKGIEIGRPRHCLYSCNNLSKQ
jgi:hypothetical protein